MDIITWTIFTLSLKSINVLKHRNVRISFKNTNTIHGRTKPKTNGNIQEQKSVGCRKSHATHVNFLMSNRLAITSNKDIKNT